MGEQNPGGYIGEAMRACRPRKTATHRALLYAGRAHPFASPTWDGPETRHMLKAAWLAGYRARKREEARRA